MNLKNSIVNYNGTTWETQGDYERNGYLEVAKLIIDRVNSYKHPDTDFVCEGVRRYGRVIDTPFPELTEVYSTQNLEDSIEEAKRDSAEYAFHCREKNSDLMARLKRSKT